MGTEMEVTSLATIALLESRLLRIEHLLYGPSAAPAPSERGSAAESLDNLERRFSSLLSRVRVYGELMKIYKHHASLFQAPSPSELPLQLSPEAVRATVLASASSFPATASSLTAVSDCSVPDPAQSSALIAQLPRMRGIEATQLAQEAEMSELRARSEEILRQWYEIGVLGPSQFVAEVETRTEKVERRVRRAEKAREAEQAL